MYKIWIITLALNIIFTQIPVTEYPNRIKQEDTIRTISHYREINTRDEEQLVELIEEIMQDFLIPAISISVVKDQSIVWERQFGYSNIDENILANQNTQFMLASVSKTVTATALMQLFENNLFSLDDDIDGFLPFNVNHPDYLTPITFRMLLTHTSGINDNWGVMPYYDGDSDLDLAYYLEQYLTPGGIFYNSSSNFTSSMPGTGFSYSNIGAALVGLLVQEISGQPFNEYCNEHIFEVLSMENTHWFLSEIDDLTHVALPYNSEGGGAYIDDCSGDGDCCLESWIGDGFSDCEDQAWDCDLSCYDNDGGDCGENSGSAYCGDGLCSTNEDFDSCPEDCPENQCGNGNLAAYEHYGYSDYPSGQLRTTSNSLAKFMGAYINSGSFNGSRILQPETIEMIKEISYPSAAPDQGLMWYYKNSEGRSLLGHNGGDMGVSTEMFISSSSDVGVIVLSNSASYNAVIQIENAVFDFAEATDFSLTGDINADSTVNIQDIVLAVNFILENEYSASADLNSDNNVDVLDIVQIVSIILN